MVAMDSYTSASVLPMDKQIDVKSSFGEDEEESVPPDSIVKVFTYELIVCRKKLNVNHNVIYVPIHV